MPTYDSGIEGQLQAPGSVRQPQSTRHQLYSLSVEPPPMQGFQISSIDQLFIFMRSLEDKQPEEDIKISIAISEETRRSSKLLPPDLEHINISLRRPIDLNRQLTDGTREFLFELARLEQQPALAITNSITEGGVGGQARALDSGVRK